MVPPTNCWDKKNLINIYRSEADIDMKIADAAGLTDNLFFKMDYDKYISPFLSSHTAADYLLSNAAKAQYPLDIGLSSVVYTHVTTLSLCKYKLSFINCKQCKGKAYNHKSDLSVWMIDFSPFLHFTYDIRDFVEYQPMVILIPIQTANNITYVTGLGSSFTCLSVNLGSETNPYLSESLYFS